MSRQGAGRKRAHQPDRRGGSAIVTGASAGLGRAVARLLAAQGWRLTLDARREAPLRDLAEQLAATTTVDAVVGDITDPDHRRQLVATASAGSAIELVINNASELGGSPPPRLLGLEEATLSRLWQVNLAAPLALVQAVRSQLSPHAVIINISSDAAVEHYPGWGGYGATKAALDHLTMTLAVEEPSLTWYAFDPGDMRTAMHQAAFPGEDISDRPEPTVVAPIVLGLIVSGLPSGRYRAADLGGIADKLGNLALG